ncbi:MAG: hypothetical protein K8L91_21085, partial [Anaerolineae bacterium]|nr:hypothetical protein [Anaerolineae bacterium]
MDQPRPLRLSSLRQKIACGVLTCLLIVLCGPQAHAQSSQTIESDDPQVQTSGTWTVQQAGAASNGSYRYSSGAEADVLTLQFSGPAIEVLYVAGPSLGTMAIEVDGTVLRTVITTADQTAYGQSARVDYLSNEPHTLRVYAQEGGIVAVDAFIIPTPS